MCGIVGCIGHTTKAEMKAFEELLFVDTLRGEDSTGIVSVNFHKKASYYKKAWPASDFLTTNKAQSLITAGQALIGHNRWATKGAVTHHNAHPFQHGTVTGVHNGTLRKQSLLPDYKDFEVDSDNVFHSINKIGVEETVQNLDGAYALVWYDDKEEKVHVIRNRERTLFYTYTTGSKQLFFASEEWMLSGILGRNRIQHGKILPFKEEHLYTFSLPEKGVVGGASIRKLKAYVAPFLPASRTTIYDNRNNVAPFKKTAGHGNTTHTFTVAGPRKDSFGLGYYALNPSKPIREGADIVAVRCYDTNLIDMLEDIKDKGLAIKATLNDYQNKSHGVLYMTISSKSIAVVGGKKKEEEGPKKEEPFRYLGYRDVPLDEKGWKEATRSGCAWCSSPVNLGEEVNWISHNEFVCSDCESEDIVKQFLM